MTKHTAELICAALLSIVAAMRREYQLRDMTGVTVMLVENGADPEKAETFAGVAKYTTG